MNKMAWMLKFLWLWPALLGTGIRVVSVAKDFSCLTVQLKTRFWNQNYFGTHYGGSLFSMTDPFYALMLVHLLGKDFVIWDKSASIKYKIATKKPVFAKFEITPQTLQDLQRKLQQQNTVEPSFSIAIKDADDNTVALVERTLHIRRKKPL